MHTQQYATQKEVPVLWLLDLNVVFKHSSFLLCLVAVTHITKGAIW